MAHRLPIFKDDLSFAERQSKVWGNMERDLERRRREWEDEIERMRKDFFTLKADDRDNHGRIEKLSDKFKMGDTLVDDARGVVEKDQNGMPVFRVRFNVQDYKPDEVNVKMDANRVIVHAKHEEKSDSKSVSREYSREVDIPKEVDSVALQCSISTDGILTVEAPMPVPQYGAIKEPPREAPPRVEKVVQSQSSTSSVTSGTRNTPPPQLQQQHPLQQPLQQQPPPSTTQPLHSSTFTTFLSGAPSQPQKFQVQQESPLFQQQSMPSAAMSTPPPPPVTQSTVSNSAVSSTYSTVKDSDRTFKIDVDIEDFNPEELSVKTVDKTLHITAKREEKIGNRTSTKELNREIHLPDTVDPYAVKAFFSDTGKLIIEAPYVKNVPISHYNEGVHHVAGR